MHRSSLLSFLVGGSLQLQLIAAADTSGCGIARDFAGQTHTGKSIESSGGTRTYDVYLPPNYDEVYPPLPLSLPLGWGYAETSQIEHANAADYFLPWKRRVF